MINENTLSTLQNIAFGTDIDALESYIIDYTQACRLSNMMRYEYNFERMRNMLEELKPDSLALTDSIELKELEADKYESAFNKYGNIRKCIAYGTQDTTVFTDVRERMLSDPEGVQDVLAILNVQGLDVIVTYKKGYLCKAYLVGESRKYTDITDICKDKVPSYIKGFAGVDEVELRGKLTILKDHSDLQTKYLNLESTVMHCIRCGVYTEYLSVIFNELISEDIDAPTQWDRLDLMRQLELSVPHHGLLRSIDADILSQALTDMDNYFTNIEQEEDILYKYYGFEVRINDSIEDRVGFIVVFDDVNYRRTFEATVKSIATKENSNMQVLKVVNTKCNNRYTVDSIDVGDVFTLEENHVSVGSKVRFRVVEGVAEIV